MSEEFLKKAELAEWCTLKEGILAQRYEYIQQALKEAAAARTEIKDLIRQQNGRIGKLERWQSLITGAVTVGWAAISLAIYFFAR